MPNSLFLVALLASGAAAANDTVTSIDGVRVGHHTRTERPTGCTVVLFDGDSNAVGVSQRGSAPGTRETDRLRPTSTAERVDAIVLSGGSAFGLDAANGAARWVAEHASRFASGTTAPLVPAAVLIDLWVGGKPNVRPDADCGYRAAAAATGAPVQQGTIGAGAGATVGKLFGLDRAMKGGIGSAAIVRADGLRVGAIVAVNPLGDVIDPQSGAVVAGVRDGYGSLADARKLLRTGTTLQRTRIAGNTTIAVVVSNARLSHAEASRVATMADDGIARAVVPAHTTADGDTVFAVATGAWSGNVDASVVGALAADVLAAAIVRAVREATGAAGVPAARDLTKR